MHLFKIIVSSVMMEKICIANLLFNITIHMIDMTY